MKKIAAILFCWLWAWAAWAAPAVQIVHSPSGIEAWLIEDHTLPIVAWQFSMTGGAGFDPADKSGTAGFLAAMLSEGSGSDDAATFAEKLQDLAADLSFGADDDYLRGSLRCLAENCPAAVALLRQALAAPSFAPEAVKRVRAQMLAAYQESRGDPATIAGELWNAKYFSAHVYGRSADQKSLSAITTADMRQAMEKMWRRGQLRIGVAGAISPSELGPMLDQAFGFMPPGQTPSPVADYTPAQTRMVTINQTMDVPQTVAVFGQPGVKRNDPDFYPLTVANHILGGGGFSSRLTTEIREKRGLTYGIGSYLSPRRYAGTIQGSVATRQDRFAQTLQLLQQIWRDFPNTITPAEVDQAKEYLLGSFPLRFSSTPRLAEILMSMQEDNLGADFLERRNDLLRAVDHAAVVAAAKKYFNPEHLLIAIVGAEFSSSPKEQNDAIPTSPTR